MTYSRKELGHDIGSCCCGLNTLLPDTGKALDAASISFSLIYSLGNNLNTSRPLVISVP
jgi:hypothetical protein